MTDNRPNPFIAAPKLLQPLIAFGMGLENAGVELSLYELVKMRASQINGCAVCLQMHSTAALGMGETVQRLIQLPGWRHSRLYNARERAALAWTEALTHVSSEAERAAVFEDVAAQFTPEEQSTLTLMITAINAFNRINVGLALLAPAENAEAA